MDGNWCAGLEESGVATLATEEGAGPGKRGEQQSLPSPAARSPLQYCMVLDGAEILETPVKEANPPVNWLTIHFLIFVIPEPSKHCEPLP